MIELTDKFRQNANIPLEYKMALPDIAARDAIPGSERFKGLKALVQDGGDGEVHEYYLSQQVAFDVNNADWVEVGGGSSVSAGIVVPTPRVDIIHGGERMNKINGNAEDHAENNMIRLHVYWTGSNGFLAYNPKIYLYKYTRSRRNKGLEYHKKGFTHPSHLNGSTHTGEKWFGGAQYNVDEELMLPLTTEFDCPTAPFLRQEIEINPNDWYGSGTGSTSITFPMKIEDWEEFSNDATRLRGIGRNYGLDGGVSGQDHHPSKTLVFRFAIVIENPMEATIGQGDTVFDGAGLDDMTFDGSGVVTTETLRKTIRIYISSEGATDEFGWYDYETETGTEGIPITGSAQEILPGINVTFASTTGHTLGESWETEIYTIKEFPYIVSDLSDPIRVFPKLGTFVDGNYFYCWKSQLGAPPKSK